MSSNIELFYNLVETYVKNIYDQKKVIEESDINDGVNQFKDMPIFNGEIREEHIKQIKNEITSKMSIKLDLGTLLNGDYKYEKWFLSKKSELDMKYWERYKKYLLNDKKFSPVVVNTMDDMLDTLTDLLGDPSIKGEFQRRGLIVGDVQSGKTSNYTGLICKAADAGYKAIVLLTGTIEKLRKQTQMRIDEGFVGMDSAAMIKQSEDSIIGAGFYDSSIHPMVLTSTMNDFKIQTARSLGFDLKSINQPVIFVVKKNVASLKNLNKWLRTFNKAGEESINQSLLLVDDESDNASVNTNPEDRNPTSINKQIRDLLNLFNKSSYVGFTATPFANIFIDPDTNDSMLKEDLFPKDYIYSLNAPSNYIGARDIFREDGKYFSMLEIIDEESIEECLPINHKNYDTIEYIPSDLKKAICTFLVANVIRDLRGDNKAHRSMLINISRFTNIQDQVNILVNSYLKDIQSAVKVFAGLEKDKALKNEYIQDLYNAYNSYYKGCGFDWDDIQYNLHKSIASVTTVVVNQRSNKSLDYEEYESAGLRVIAIGGLSLSRGLTLEGLMVSYLYRNSKMYDTLMQMGRWFGYRKNYEDLCKIWMTEESISWYEHISEATDELREEIKKYENSGLTPKDFGLRVRSDINTLLVTARNKMRTASSQEISVSLSGEVIETPSIYEDKSKNINNQTAVDNLLTSLNNIDKKPIKPGKSYVYYKDVDKKHILELLNNIEVPLANTFFDTNSIVEFVDGYKGKELEKWDIGFVSGKSERTFNIEDKEIHLIERAFSLENENKILRMNGNHNRIGSAGEGKIGLDKDQLDIVHEMHEKKYNGKKKSIPQKFYFNSISRNPLLLIYMVALGDYKLSENEYVNKIKDKYKDTPLIGFGIGIPSLQHAESKYIRYTTNKVHQMLNDEDFNYIGDEE